MIKQIEDIDIFYNFFQSKFDSMLYQMPKYLLPSFFKIQLITKRESNKNFLSIRTTIFNSRFEYNHSQYKLFSKQYWHLIMKSQSKLRKKSKNYFEYEFNDHNKKPCLRKVQNKRQKGKVHFEVAEMGSENNQSNVISVNDRKVDKNQLKIISLEKILQQKQLTARKQHRRVSIFPCSSDKNIQNFKSSSKKNMDNNKITQFICFTPSSNLYARNFIQQKNFKSLSIQRNKTKSKQYDRTLLLSANKNSIPQRSNNNTVKKRAVPEGRKHFFSSINNVNSKLARCVSLGTKNNFLSNKVDTNLVMKKLHQSSLKNIDIKNDTKFMISKKYEKRRQKPIIQEQPNLNFNSLQLLLNQAKPNYEQLYMIPSKNKSTKTILVSSFSLYEQAKNQIQQQNYNVTFTSDSEDDDEKQSEQQQKQIEIIKAEKQDNQNNQQSNSSKYFIKVSLGKILNDLGSSKNGMGSSSVLIRKKNLIDKALSEIGEEDDNKNLLEKYKKIEKQASEKVYSKSDISSNNDISSISSKSFHEIDNTHFFNVLQGQPIFFLNKNFSQSISNQSSLIQIIRIFLKSNKNTLNYLTLEVWFRFNGSILIRRVTWQQSKRVQILQQSNNLRKGIKNKTAQRFRRKKIMNIWEKRIKMILGRIFLKSFLDEKEDGQDEERQSNINIRQSFRSKTTTGNQQFQKQSERTEIDKVLLGKKSKFAQQIMSQRKLGNLRSARHLDDMIQFIEDYSFLQRSYLGYIFIKQEQLSHSPSQISVSKQLVTTSLKKRWFNKHDESASSDLQTMHRIKKACQFYMLVYLNDTLFLIKCEFKGDKNKKLKMQKFSSMCSLKVQTESVIPIGRETYYEQWKQISFTMLIDLTKNENCHFSQELNSLYFEQLFQNYQLNHGQNSYFPPMSNFYDLQTDNITEEYKATLRFRRVIQKYMHDELVGVHIKSALNKKQHYFIRELNRIKYPQIQLQQQLKQQNRISKKETTQIIFKKKSSTQSYKPSAFRKSSSYEDEQSGIFLQNQLQLSANYKKKNILEQNHTFGWRKAKQYVFLNADTVNFFKEYDCFNYGVVIDAKNHIEDISESLYFFVELYSDRLNRIKLDKTEKQINQALGNLLQAKIAHSQIEKHSQQEKRIQFYIYVKQGIKDFSIKLQTQLQMERFIILNLPQYLPNNIRKFFIQGFFQRYRQKHMSPFQIVYNKNLLYNNASSKNLQSLKNGNVEQQLQKYSQAVYDSRIIKKCRIIKNKYTIVDVSIDPKSINFIFTCSTNKKVNKFTYPLVDFHQLTKKLMISLSDESNQKTIQSYRSVTKISTKFYKGKSKQQINTMIEWELKTIEKFISLLFFHKKVVYSGLTILSLYNLEQIQKEVNIKSQRKQRMTASTFKNQNSMSSFKRRNNSHFQVMNSSILNQGNNLLGNGVLNPTNIFTQNYNILKKYTIKIHYGIYAFITIYKLIGFDIDEIKVQIPRFQKTYVWDVNHADTCQFSEVQKMVTNYLRNQIFKNQIQQTNYSLQKRFEKQYGHLIHNFSMKSTRRVKGMRPSVLEAKINMGHENLMNFMQTQSRRKIGIQPRRKSLYSQNSKKFKGLKNKQSLILDGQNFLLENVNEEHKIQFFNCGNHSYYIKIYTSKNVEQNPSGKVTIILHKKYSISYLRFCLQISDIIKLLNRKSMKDWVVTTRSNFFDVVSNKEESTEIICQRRLMPSEWNKILSYVQKAIKVSNGRIFNISRNLRFLFYGYQYNQQSKQQHRKLKQSLKCQISKKHLVELYSENNQEDNLLMTRVNNISQKKVKALYKDIKKNKTVVIDEWTASFGTQIPFKHFNNRLFRRFCRDIIKMNEGKFQNSPNVVSSRRNNKVDKSISKSCYIIDQISISSERQDD